MNNKRQQRLIEGLEENTLETMLRTVDLKNILDNDECLSFIKDWYKENLIRRIDQMDFNNFKTLIDRAGSTGYVIEFAFRLQFGPIEAWEEFSKIENRDKKIKDLL